MIYKCTYARRGYLERGLPDLSVSVSQFATGSRTRLAVREQEAEFQHVNRIQFSMSVPTSSSGVTYPVIEGYRIVQLIGGGGFSK